MHSGTEQEGLGKDILKVIILINVDCKACGPASLLIDVVLWSSDFFSQWLCRYLQNYTTVILRTLFFVHMKQNDMYYVTKIHRVARVYHCFMFLELRCCCLNRWCDWCLLCYSRDQSFDLEFLNFWSALWDGYKESLHGWMSCFMVHHVTISSN